MEGGPARNGRTQRSSPLGHLCCVCCGLLLCARARVCAAHLGPRLDEATVEVVEGDHRVHQLVHLGLGGRLEELAREPLERLLAVSLVQHLHVQCMCVCMCLCVRMWSGGGQVRCGAVRCGAVPLPAPHQQHAGQGLGLGAWGLGLGAWGRVRACIASSSATDPERSLSMVRVRVSVQP